MKGLAATNKSLLVFDEDGYYDILHTESAEYYGITYDNQHIYCFARTKKDKGAGGHVLVYDYDLKNIGYLKAPFALRNVHQICKHKDDLYILCTFDNIIAKYSFKNDNWSVIKPVKEYVGGDYHHFNSILFWNNFVYLLAKNNDNNTNSEVYKYSLDFDFIDGFKLGYGSHNLWSSKSEICTLSSVEAKVLSETKVLYDFDGKAWLRGASILPNKYFVGSSPFAQRDYRPETTGSIFIFDRKWNIIKEIYLHNQGGVHDLRVPGFFDFSHPSFIGKPIR